MNDISYHMASVQGEGRFVGGAQASRQPQKTALLYRYATCITNRKKKKKRRLWKKELTNLKSSREKYSSCCHERKMPQTTFTHTYCFLLKIRPCAWAPRHTRRRGSVAPRILKLGTILGGQLHTPSDLLPGKLRCTRLGGRESTPIIKFVKYTGHFKHYFRTKFNFPYQI